MKESVKTPITDKLRSAMYDAKREVRRVLLVDDDDNLLVMMKIVINESFFSDVVLAHTTSGARAILDSGEAFVGVILDARVVNGNGVSLYRYIASRWPEMKVVFLTGYDSPQFRKEVAGVGPAPVYEKENVTADFMEKLLTHFGVLRKPLPGT